MRNHIFPKSCNRWLDKHNNRWRSLGFHIAIETVLDIVSKPASIFFRYTKNVFIYKLLKFPFNMVYGFNCGFKMRDTILYLVNDLGSKEL